MKKIYIMLSHSGTMPSKAIKLITKYKYTHVSISLDNNLDTMYSFGRKKYNNPFIGGFIVESKNNLFYKKFSNTKCIILEFDITDFQYLKLKRLINVYKENMDIYKYDIIGLLLKVFKINYKRKNHSVCTEFVGNLLKSTNIYEFNNNDIRPIDFMNIPNKKIIYEGLLRNY